MTYLFTVTMQCTHSGPRQVVLVLMGCVVGASQEKLMAAAAADLLQQSIGRVSEGKTSRAPSKAMQHGLLLLVLLVLQPGYAPPAARHSVQAIASCAQCDVLQDPTSLA
jgi:hypothetical protein